ncbi:MAG: NADPH:quinone oxidoreductase [Elusimicrobia bacterium RIFOXYB2_FULL_49_7]|nr:MAG: NADPH:quinone oxidoreductase [Elusimicrobia bacterium RIFOXYB2_FULL_49_7]
MKAMIHTHYGPPEVLHLADVPMPVLKDNEVLIKVHAATVNRTDSGFRKAEPFIVRFFSGLFKPKRQILGNEFAGEIEETGKHVTSFKKGDQVFGQTGDSFGAHAEYLCLPEDGAVALKPVTMSYEEAAAVCDGMMLAVNYLRAFNIQKDQKILIYGASGSIGTAAVQLAKYYGAYVTAVCNTKNVETVKSLGADRVVDYTTTDFTKDTELYDFVFDAVGKTSYFHCKNLMKPNATYSATDFGYLLQNVFLTLWTSFFGSRKVIFPLPKENRKDILFFKEIIETGHYKAVIDKRYPLDQIVEATRYVETEKKTGNVVITV